MTTVALLDGEAVSAGVALPLDARGVLLGDSVFETMRAYGGRVLSLDAHLDRLERSAAWARLRPNAPRETLARECESAAERVGEAVVRVFVLRGAAGDGALVDQPTRRLVLAEPAPNFDELRARGATACVLARASFATAEVEHAKYARYLPRLLARDEARERGCDDALLADDAGRILEAATGSVFAVVRGGLVSTSVLPGITRATVLELARGMGMSAELRAMEAGDVEWASEMFVTSSVREILPIVRVDGRAIGEGVPGETARALQAALRATLGR